MGSLSMSGRGDAAEVADLLAREIPESGLSCQEVGRVTRTVGGTAVYVMVFEKYYMRASNRVSLTVVVTGENGRVSVDAIGAGGGQGPLFSFSWGAEEDFEDTVAAVLEPLGFQKT
ncbi:hypothetical protein SDC9_141911 [bioreactor metagenome]|uniref:Uncharacterized protein n=1 Tax=bioreactor metagenome TaxID=1076179 RepID=A0A645E1Q5_9ZZZZ